jgi:hypothetical protein
LPAALATLSLSRTRGPLAFTLIAAVRALKFTVLAACRSAVAAAVHVAIECVVFVKFVLDIIHAAFALPLRHPTSLADWPVLMPLHAVPLLPVSRER